MKSMIGTISRPKGDGARKAKNPTRQASAPEAGSQDCTRERMIAEAAYFHAERRGFAPGNEVSDWLHAEAEIEQSQQGPDREFRQ